MSGFRDGLFSFRSPLLGVVGAKVVVALEENDKGSLREKTFVIVVEKMKKMIIVTISLELKVLLVVSPVQQLASDAICSL